MTPAQDGRGPIYVGDGVYVRFDGYALWLSTDAQLPRHEIALEPEVWARLVEARKELMKPLTPQAETR